MIPSSRQRVPGHTAEEINRSIQQGIAKRIAHHAEHPAGVAKRLRELDREWDIERAIEANAATLALGGVVLGVTADRRWLALSALVTGFLLQHAVQGWCPPVPILRRLGFRTADEINQERYGLKALQGDFGELGRSEDRVAKIADAVGVKRRAKSGGRHRKAS